MRVKGVVGEKITNSDPFVQCTNLYSFLSPHTHLFSFFLAPRTALEETILKANPFQPPPFPSHLICSMMVPRAAPLSLPGRRTYFVVNVCRWHFKKVSLTHVPHSSQGYFCRLLFLTHAERKQKCYYQFARIRSPSTFTTTKFKKWKVKAKTKIHPVRLSIVPFMWQ